jgi:CBS domain-containing protein
MTPHATTVLPAMSLREVASMIVAAGFGGLPVALESGELVGFLSEIDVAHALLQGGFERTAGEAMNTDVISVDEFATADEVIRTLREHRMQHLPVVRLGVVVGIITPMDVIRYFLGRGDDAA